MSFEDQPSHEVRPAQLSFLAIYNPSLASTDEAVREQIVFYYSQAARLRKATKGHGPETSVLHDEEENEKLRQVGLAQGMLDFAKNFSDGKPIDSVDTERSRIILHELEPGWWILVSIGLTRLPVSRSTTRKETSAEEQFEYSSREVAPPPLLLRQLLRAHSIFLLHHGPSLSDLFKRSSRNAFCDLLDRFWSRYAKNWDVLLHGNPAVDMYNGVKLAAGGELGIGVGEEDWGSGEREVLEDFISRTEGLVDLIISRFGDAPAERAKDEQVNGSKPSHLRQDPWLGTDSDPRSSDGVLFSGVGAVSRRSLATVSQWMEWIYKYGEGAYGVRENPSSRYRRRRKQPLASGASLENESRSRRKQVIKETVPQTGSEAHKLRREAIERRAVGPIIPPPIVSTTEKSVDKTPSKVESREESPFRTSKRETDSENSGHFATDKMMKVLSLGYGSSWTLSPKGLVGNKSSEKQPIIETVSSQKGNADAPDTPPGDDGDACDELPLREVDPTPEISNSEEVPFLQRLEQSIGKFIIGFSGDLENTEMMDDEPMEVGNISTSQAPQRVVVRILTLEVIDAPVQLTSSSAGDLSSVSPPSDHCANTNSGATGSAPSIGTHQKFQVAVYIHQPFIFTFLFTLHTPMLMLPSFYRSIHHRLGPLQRPLLRSTDPMKVAQRIADAVGERRSTTIPAGREAWGGSLGEAQTIYDIIFDPAKLTVRTSIPNIPLPGTFGAEGLSLFSKSPVVVSGAWYTLGIPISNSSLIARSQTGSEVEKSPWTRVEALNVHTQILNTWSATHGHHSVEGRMERERTVKTGRGWWILWMRVPSTSNDGVEPDKEAFLVRKARDHTTSTRRRDGGSTASGSRWLRRDQSRDISSSSSTVSGAGATGMAGINEGVGVDARKWIDGLLSLNR